MPAPVLASVVRWPGTAALAGGTAALAGGTAALAGGTAALAKVDGARAVAGAAVEIVAPAGAAFGAACPATVVDVVVVALGVVAAPAGVGASTSRATVDRVANTPASSVDALGALPVISGPAFGCEEAAVLRRGVGVSPVSFWPSASAVRATWSSSTLANRAGGPVADPGGPLAAAPGSIEVAASVAGPRAVTAPGRRTPRRERS